MEAAVVFTKTEKGLCLSYVLIDILFNDEAPGKDAG